MALKNTADSYGWLAKVLHWGMAVMLVSLVAVGLYMSDMPRGDEKSAIIRLHASSGLLVIMLLAVRLVWKLMNNGPEPMESPPVQQWIARLTHWGLYAVIAFQVVSGSMSLMTVGWDLPFFGMFSIPTLYERDMDLHHLWEDLHVISWYTLAGLTLLHLCGALYHQFIKKTGIIARMT